MGILKDTLKEFVSDDCPRMAAALSYYTMFSLPGLLILVMLMAGVFADAEDLRGRLLGQIQVLIGTAGAEQIQAILEHADRPGSGNPLMVIGSAALLLFAATGVFAQLQGALNRTWEVEPDPERGGMVRNFLMKRVLSFLMILGVALLLLASLLAQTVLTAFGDFVQWLLPDPFSSVALRTLSIVLSLVMASLLFGVLFQILPDARVRWRDAWKGAAATGLLFIIGNVLLGLYLSRSDPGSAFGAAGSLALILIWIYYSSMIFFFGAELTQVLARRRGESIRPSRGAVRVVLERKTIRELRDERSGLAGESMTEVPELDLPGGVAIPQVGCGTWMLKGRDCEHAVSEALDLGYTHIDTASGYGNEADVGRAIRRADRERLFITSKVWRAHLEPDPLRRVCEESLRELGTDYLDLLLVHWPNSAIPIQETVDGFRQLRDDGLIRAWGVSNFTSAHLREAVEVETPSTNQVELHPYFNQERLRRVCGELGVPVTAYTPLAKGRVMDDPVLREIGGAHGKSPAQVALRWSLQHGHIVIPKASSREHLRSNLDVLDFELSHEEMDRIDSRPQGDRIVDGEWSEFDRGEG